MAAGDISKQMLSRLRYRLGDPGGIIYDTDAIYRALNFGFSHIANLLPDSALWRLCAIDEVSVISGVQGYALPDDFLRERIVTYKGLPARRWDVSELGTLGLGTLAAPSETSPYYYIWDGKINFLFEVTAPGTFTVYYIKQPAEISNTVDPSLGLEVADLVEMTAQASLLQASPETQPHASALLEQVRIICDTIAMRYVSGYPYEGQTNDPRRVLGGTKSTGER